VCFGSFFVFFSPVLRFPPCVARFSAETSPFFLLSELGPFFPLGIPLMTYTAPPTLHPLANFPSRAGRIVGSFSSPPFPFLVPGSGRFCSQVSSADFSQVPSPHGCSFRTYYICVFPFRFFSYLGAVNTVPGAVSFVGTHLGGGNPFFFFPPPIHSRGKPCSVGNLSFSILLIGFLTAAPLSSPPRVMS